MNEAHNFKQLYFKYSLLKGSPPYLQRQAGAKACYKAKEATLIKFV